MKIPRAVPLLALLVPLAAAGGDGLLAKKPASQEFLPVDEAFELGPLEWKGDTLYVDWRIAPEYYLYRDRLKFTLAQPAGAKLGAPQLPAAQPYDDEIFGKTHVYRDSLRTALPVAGVAADTVKLTVVYQGCADAGLCYPPQTRTLEARR